MLSKKDSCKNLTEEEVIRKLCRLTAIVWERLDPKGSTPNDCFCDERPCDPLTNMLRSTFGGSYFQFEGSSLRFIENAVMEKLDREHPAS